jgi:hypothetical protein
MNRRLVAGIVRQPIKKAILKDTPENLFDPKMLMTSWQF